MITKQHLRMYQTHRGDSEMVFREGTPAELAAVQDGTWALIEDLIQVVRTLESGRASPEVATELYDKIQRNTADAPTRQLLQKLARDWPRIHPRWPLRIFQWMVLGLLKSLFGESSSGRWVAGLLLWVSLCALVRFMVESVVK